MSRGDSQAQGWMRQQLLLSAACKRRQQKDELRMARKERKAAKTAGGRKMNGKQEFVEYLRASATKEEVVLAPAHPDPGRNALLLDRGWYGMCEHDEEYEEYTGEDGFPGYCAEAVVLRGVAPAFKEIAVWFEEACRSAYSIYEYSPGPGLVWKNMADFEWDVSRFLEAK